MDEMNNSQINQEFSRYSRKMLVNNTVKNNIIKSDDKSESVVLCKQDNSPNYDKDIKERIRKATNLNNGVSPGNLNIKTGDTSNSVISSFKDSDFDFIINDGAHKTKNSNYGGVSKGINSIKFD